MRAAPGFAPRAIARYSRRIDIAKDPLRRRTSVAEKREPRVNSGDRPSICSRLGPTRQEPGRVPPASVPIPKFASIRGAP